MQSSNLDINKIDPESISPNVRVLYADTSGNVDCVDLRLLPKKIRAKYVNHVKLQDFVRKYQEHMKDFCKEKIIMLKHAVNDASWLRDMKPKTEAIAAVWKLLGEYLPYRPR